MPPQKHAQCKKLCIFECQNFGFEKSFQLSFLQIAIYRKITLEFFVVGKKLINLPEDTVLTAFLKETCLIVCIDRLNCTHI